MAARFDANTDTLVSTTGVPTGTFTLTCWAIRDANRGGFQTLFTTDAGTSTGMIVQTYDDGITLFVWSSAGSSNGLLPMNVGTWYRVALVKSGSTVTLYAAPQGSPSLMSESTSAPTAALTTFRVGGSAFSGEWLNGRIAALKVWSAALNATEVAAELAQYAPVRSANLLRRHDFIDSTVDLSGNGYTFAGGSTPVTWEAGPDIPTGGVRSSNAWLQFFP